MAKTYYGGQAVLEGVMMRGRGHAAVAVRRPNGEIVRHSETLPSALYRRRLAQLPLLRGLVALWEMMVLGTRMMLFSANVRARGQFEREIPRRVVAIMLTVSLALAVALFFVIPLLLARASHVGAPGGFAPNLVEGAVRLLLFVGYVAVLGRTEQMGRVFQYHGAEHKTINAYEHGAPLVPSAVQRFSTIHVRCGTAFLLWVLVISIFVFALIGHPPLLVGVLARIVLVPLIAALSYEVLRLGARWYHLRPVRLLLQPGLWLQHLTTREPTDDQVAVAIAALESVLAADGVPAARAEAWAGQVQPSHAQS